MKRIFHGTLVCASVMILIQAVPEYQGNGSFSVYAQQGDVIAQQLNSTDGGMASYGSSIQSATSSAASQQAVTSWSTYTQSRSVWGLSAMSVSRLANAD